MHSHVTLLSEQFFMLDHVCVSLVKDRTLESGSTSPDFRSGPVEVPWNKNVGLESLCPALVHV